MTAEPTTTVAERSSPPDGLDGFPVLDARSLPDAFQKVAAHFGDTVALRAGDGSVELTWAQYRDRV